MTAGAQPVRRRAGLGLAGSALLWLALALGAAPSAGAETPTDEAGVHAAYVLNFVRYSRWPEPSPPERPYVIAVLGPLEAVAALRGLARRAGRIDGRPVVVKLLALNTAAPPREEAVPTLRQELADVHAVYVGASHRSWSGAVVAATAGRPVLTVGAGSRFASAGGMFGLVEQQGRVVFVANPDAIRASPLQVSARVLALSRPAPEPAP